MRGYDRIASVAQRAFTDDAVEGLERIPHVPRERLDREDQSFGQAALNQLGRALEVARVGDLEHVEELEAVDGELLDVLEVDLAGGWRSRAGDVRRPQAHFRACHDLRVTGATNAIVAGMHPAKPQQELGHSDYSTTQRYVDLAGTVFADEAVLLERRLLGAVESSTVPSEPEST
jgi:hypothetical protein